MSCAKSDENRGTMPQKPPTNLTAKQAETWRLVADSPGITAALFPVLAEYCRCVALADAVAAQVDAFEPAWSRTDEGLARWDRLLAMQDRLAGRIASLATRLKLTPQTRIRAVTAGRIVSKGCGPKPWQ